MSTTILKEASGSDDESAEFDLPEPEELVTEEEVEDLFNKNTESFRCLAQVLISRSSLLRHPLYHFPPLEDPGFDKVFYNKEPEIPPDNTGCEEYKKICKELNIPPISRVLRSLPERTLDLKFHALGDKALRAVVGALSKNEFVEELILEDSFLSVDSCKRINEFMLANKKLCCLNLKQCNIGPEGAAELSEGILQSTTLVELDLSYNELGDVGLTNLEDALSYNTTMTKLNLCRNHLGDESAFILSRIFDVNNRYSDVDLAWNELNQGPGNKALFKVLEDAFQLRILSLAWNGLESKDAVTPLSRYLRCADTLQHLDISNNRITGKMFPLIRGALAKCTDLVSLKIGGNPLTPQEAFSVARLVNNCKKLKFVSLENAFLEKNFLPFWKRQTRRGVSIIIEGILDNYEIYGPDMRKVVFNRANLMAAKTKKKNFGHFILQLPTNPIAKQQFLKLVKSFKMKKFDKDLVTALCDQFPAKKNKINVVGMRESYMTYFPNICLPPKKQKKKKAKKEAQVSEGTGTAMLHDLPPMESLLPTGEVSLDEEEEDEYEDGTFSSTEGELDEMPEANITHPLETEAVQTLTVVKSEMPQMVDDSTPLAEEQPQETAEPEESEAEL